MLIAGGTGSIGMAIAAHALGAGWDVVIHGRDQAKSARCVQHLRDIQDAAEIRAITADIEEHGAIERLVAEACAWRGRLDAVVDCVAAGPAKRLAGAFAQTEKDGYGVFLDHSVAHLQRLAHAALPALARNGGTLIAFASDAGRFAAPNQSIIGASRAGIIGFVRNLAVEVARDGVRIHCVSPSFVEDTSSAARLDSPRMTRARERAGLGLPAPEDIAPVVLFLCGPGARKITGQVISINGGVNA